MNNTTKLTLEQMQDKAEADHNHLRGKVVQVSGAQISNGFIDWWQTFSPPLLVTVTDVFENVEGTEADWSENLLETYWNAEALPGQLPLTDYVHWIQGPTYYENGKVSGIPPEYHTN
jgi:hypothetical protein